MTKVPSKGFCHAVFLLIHAARLKALGDVSEWVAAAKSRQTIMASALDLCGVARRLVETSLVSAKPEINLSETWNTVGDIANYEAFLQIAVAYLKHCPPVWISTCFVKGDFHSEFIPTNDFGSLKWMGDDLEPVLRQVHYELRKQKENAENRRLGELGELAFIEILKRAGHTTRHVSKISDSYGYDIESEKAGEKRYWEVKSCTSFTKGRFFISRNEVRRAQTLGNSWALVQIIFEYGTHTQEIVSPEDVGVRVLPSNELLSICPVQSNYFDWLDSAVVRPREDSWRDTSI